MSRAAASATATASTGAAPGAPARRFLVEAILFTTYAAFGLSWIAVTPLLADLGRDFGVGTTALGLQATMVTVAKVIAPLATGALAARFGQARTLLAGALLIAVAAAASAAAPGFTSFVSARFVFGVGGAVVVTLLGPTVMQWFPRGELPLVNALNNVAVNSGIALTLYITVPLAARLGWRGTLSAYAAVNVALFVLGALLVRDRLPRTARPDVAQAGGQPERGSFLRGYTEVWRRRETWLVTAAFTFPLALYLAFNTWLPRHFVEALHLDKGAAARLSGLVNLVGIPAAITGGVLTRKLGRRRPFLVGAGLFIAPAACGMFLLRDPALLSACAVVLGTCFFIGGAPLFTAAMELPGMTPDSVGRLMGTVFSFGYLVASGAPLLVGALREASGSFVPGLSLWAAASALLAVAGLLLPETGPGPAPPAGPPGDSPGTGRKTVDSGRAPRES